MNVFPHYHCSMKTLAMIICLTPLVAYSQNRPLCATPMDCYQVKEKQRMEEIRLKEAQEEAVFRQQQLELEAAQLREIQEQRAVLEEELTEMNETQLRIEERELEAEEAKKAK